MVFRQAATQMRDRLAVEERAEVARRGDVHVLLHVAEAHERSMRDAVRDAAHLGDERVAREDTVHEPEPRRLVGGEELRQKEQFLRLCGPDPPRELPGGAEVAAEPDLREGGAEAGTVGGEAQVTRERDAEAGARRRAVDRRDRHLRDRREEPGELVHLVLAIDVIFERPPCGARRAHRGDVASGTEGAPCPGHEHGADLGVGCTAPERGDGGVDHRVGEGVEAVGPVERQRGDSVVELEDEILRVRRLHRRPPYLVSGLGRSATILRYSSSAKARSVSVRVLPLEAIVSASFATVASSGASATAAASYLPVTR